MLTQTQRDNILAVISSYEERMKIIRDCFEHRKPVPKEYEAYVDPLKDKDVVAAFESLIILLACVQELERQREFLVSHFADNGLCFMPLDFDCSERSKNGCYCYAERYVKEACAVDRAEEAAKEAGKN